MAAEKALDFDDILSSVFKKMKKAIIAKAGEKIKDEWEKIKVDSDLVFKKYLKNSYDKYSKIKTILCLSEPQYIYKLFVSPNLKIKRNKYIDSSDVNNILDLSHFLIIKGDGGIGKSTLMKHLFINELEHKDLIPIFIELQDVNDVDEEYDIRDFIFSKLDNLGSTLKEDYLEYALGSGCFLFLFDGYDEISREKKNAFFKKLINFSDKYSENYFIVSSRPESEFIEFQRFTVLKLCDFTKEQAILLISKIDFDVEIKEKFLKALDNFLYYKHPTFASNPLLLNVMLLTYRNYAEIPEKVHLFYADAFDTLMRKHDATKGGFKRSFKTKLSPADFKKILSKFCYITYYHNKLKFTHDELVSFLKNSKSKDIDFSYDDMVDDLKDALCFIYRDGIHYFFTHRSFQEYFTAVFFYELSDENMKKMSLKLIKKNPNRATYDSTFSMLYDMTTERFEQNILLPLLESIEKDNTDDKYDFYLNYINIQFTFDDYEDTGEIWRVFENNHNYIAEFIKRFTYKYRKNIIKKTKIEDQKLFVYLVNIKGYRIHQIITYENIIKDRQIYNILKKTWIGELIQTMANLKDILTAKKRESDLDLEELLEIS